MSLKELAQSLDGMEYPFSLPDGIEVDKDFVIVFGASDIKKRESRLHLAIIQNP